jgi:hypothetical protein
MLKLALVLVLAPLCACRPERTTRLDDDAPTARKAAKPEPGSTVMEWKGQQGGSAGAASRVILDKDAWESLWRDLSRPAPPFDFAERAAIALFAGERPTGGYGIEIVSERSQGDDYVVRWRVRAPSGFATQAFTNPWIVREVPRPKGRILVEEPLP